MEPIEIERVLSERIRGAIERAVCDAMAEINAAGHRYEAADAMCTEWREPGADEVVQIFWTLGVSLHTPQPVTAQEVEVEAFYARAGDGSDADAARLATFEGELANGGFHQLHANHGAGFFDEVEPLLRGIGAKKAAKLVAQARDTVARSAGVFDAYRAACDELNVLDRKFYRNDESIAHLYEAHRAKTGGR